MNLWEVIINSAQECDVGVPSSTTKPTLQQYIQWGRKGQALIAAYTGCVQKMYPIASVARQEKYSLGADFVRPEYVEYSQGTTSNYYLKYLGIDEYRMVTNGTSSGRPEFFTIKNRDLYIWPPPSSTATASTIAGGDLTTSNTTVTIADNDDFFSRGTVILTDADDTTFGIEYVDYTNKSTSVETLTGCTRRQHGSEKVVPITFTTGDTVKQANIKVYGQARYLNREPNVYTTGTAAFAQADATVTGTNTLWTTDGNALPTWQIGTGTNPSKFYDISSVTTSTGLELTVNFAEANVSTTNYVLASLLDIPDEYFDILSMYMSIQCKKLLQYTSEVRMMSEEFWGLVRDMTNQYIDRTDTEYGHMRDSQLWG